MPTSPPPSFVEHIKDELKNFIHGIDALQLSFHPSSFLTFVVGEACKADLAAMAKTGFNEDGSAKSEHVRELIRLRSRCEKTQKAVTILPQAFLVALVSQYDGFIGGMLRCFYRAIPDMLHSSKRNISYSQLCKFENLEKAKEYVLEKRIESTLRLSHAKQFKVMEKRFKVRTLTELPAWKPFIELTQRRHLFVHCRGKVSDQYLSICDEHKVDFNPRPNVNDTLDVTSDYFLAAHACIFEIGTKLVHTLWRKNFPDDRKNADGNLIHIIYDLLKAERYELAVCIGEFAYRIPGGHYDNEVSLTMALNLAQAYKWKGNQQKATEIVNEKDWSATSAKFKLAVAVIQDNWKDAAVAMQDVSTEDIPEHDYGHWPIFKEFRKTQEFLEAFKTKFGRPFQPVPSSSIDTFWPLITTGDISNWRKPTHKADAMEVESSEHTTPKIT